MVSGIDLKLLIQATQSEMLLALYLNFTPGTINNKQAKTLGEAKILAQLARQLLTVPNFGIAKQQGYLLNYAGLFTVHEEFDILRFSSHSVFNLELKRQFPEKRRIIDQLRRHKLVLDQLGKETILCTYVASTKTIFRLANDQLHQINYQQLANLIADNYVFENELAAFARATPKNSTPVTTASKLKIIFSEES